MNNEMVTYTVMKNYVLCYIWPLPFRGDSLETKKGARELGLSFSQVCHQIFQKLNKKTKFFWHV